MKLIKVWPKENAIISIDYENSLSFVKHTFIYLGCDETSLL
jgi:hypothetical protein